VKEEPHLESSVRMYVLSIFNGTTNDGAVNQSGHGTQSFNLHSSDFESAVK
jgi:hypothetical protein